MNYHVQKIRWILKRDIRKRWTDVSTLLGLISSVYRDFLQWISNQRPQNAKLKLHHRSTNPHHTQVLPNKLVMVLCNQSTWMCLASYICTLYIGHGHLQGHVFSGGLEIRIQVIVITPKARIQTYIFLSFFLK